MKKTAMILPLMIFFSSIANAGNWRFDPGEALVEATLIRDNVTAIKLLNSGANPNFKGKFGITPLLAAVYKSDTYNSSLTLIELLLSKGADVNASDDFGHTVLMAASSNNVDFWGNAEGRNWNRDREVFDLLLSNGAQVNSLDQHGNSALYYACRAHYSIEVFQYHVIGKLLSAGAVVSERMLRLLFEAISGPYKGHSNTQSMIDESLRLIGASLKQNGTWSVNWSELGDIKNYLLNVDQFFPGGGDILYRAVHMALSLDHSPALAESIIKASIKLGAKLNKKTSWGTNALDRAVSSVNENSTAIVKALLDGGYNPDIQTSSGHTALMTACSHSEKQTLDIVRLLIKAGANVNLRNENGYTALTIAENAYGHNEEIILAIKAAGGIH